MFYEKTAVIIQEQIKLLKTSNEELLEKLKNTVKRTSDIYNDRCKVCNQTIPKERKVLNFVLNSNLLYF